MRELEPWEVKFLLALEQAWIWPLAGVHVIMRVSRPPSWPKRALGRVEIGSCDPIIPIASAKWMVPDHRAEFSRTVM